MKDIIDVSIIVLNVFVIFMLFKLQKEKNISKSIAMTAVIYILNLVIINVVYKIGSLGISNIVSNASRNLIIFSFLPINIIAMAFPIMIFMSLESSANRNKKMLILIIIDLIIIISECKFIKSIQLNIENINDNIINNSVQSVENNIYENHILNNMLNSNDNNILNSNENNMSNNNGNNMLNN